MIFAKVELERTLAQIGTLQVPQIIFSAKTRRLLLHVLDEIGALNAFGPPGKIFYQRSDGQLSAGLMALDDQRFQVRARGINRRRKPGTPRAQNDCFTYRVHGLSDSTEWI